MFDLIQDSKGFLSLMDALISIFILFMILIAFNMIVDIEIPSLSEESNGFKTSQDLMDIMSSNVDARDHSILERISFILSTNNNSASSRREAKKILDDFFASYFENCNYYHYSFVESNQLNGEILSSNGDYSSAEKVNVAIRNYGNYSYKLYIF